jgi:DNA-binding CsgD family transcriptional regulator
MGRDLNSAEWQIAVAGLIGADAGRQSADALIAAIPELVVHDGVCLLLFHKDAPPEVLHHTLNAARSRHYLDRYLAGPYLLDPLYQLAVGKNKPGICRYRDATPDRFRSSELYRQYYERTHLADEIDFLLDVSPTATLALVIGRFERRFRRDELARLHKVEPLVHATMRKIWLGWPRANARVSQDRAMHARLTRCFENFGGPLLTERERETTQLLLRGFSTKAIARQLEIAPGTVMVHKRNIFSKLGISSQFELFSQFIESLAEQ